MPPGFNPFSFPIATRNPNLLDTRYFRLDLDFDFISIISIFGHPKKPGNPSELAGP